MNATVRTLAPFDETQPRTIYAGPRAGIWIECEIVHPPSSARRSVDVHVPAELIPGMLKALREAAILDRSEPMSS